MLSKLVEKYEFLVYTTIGGVATLIDWIIFAISVHYLGAHYEVALALAYFGASIVHYTANKLITFQCKSKNYRSQLPLYILVVTISLMCSMTVMALLVNLLPANKILLRVVTTILMLIPNYLLHKHITFSKTTFAQVQQI